MDSEFEIVPGVVTPLSATPGVVTPLSATPGVGTPLSASVTHSEQELKTGTSYQDNFYTDSSLVRFSILSFSCTSPFYQTLFFCFYTNSSLGKGPYTYYVITLGGGEGQGSLDDNDYALRGGGG